MKRVIHSFLTGAILLLAACSHPGQEWIDFSVYSNGANIFQPTSESDFDLSTLDWTSIEEQCTMEDSVTVAANGPQRVSSFTATDMIREIFDMLFGKSVHQVAGTYRSVDVYGDTLTVSGKVMYPSDGKIRNLILISHYTIGADREAPSQTYPFEGIYAALGYCVIAADYIGYGVTVDSIHPYLQADVCARNVIDMGLAVRPFLAKRGLQIADDSIILLGYSQGGACTLHTMRLLETYPDYAGDFKIKKVYAGAGPYDVAKTYDYSMKIDKTGIPCAVPMIVQGMSIGMRSNPLDMNYFFREPLKSNYKQWLNSKKYTVKEINNLIGSNYLSEIMTADACDKTKKETARFYQELLENSVSPHFIPQADLYMFHSEDDNTVPFVNSQKMQRQFREAGCTNVEYEFGHYGNHMMGAVIFIYKTMKILK